MLLLTSTLESFFQLLVVLFIFAAVLAMTYFTTRWVGGYQKAAARTSNLAVVESLCLTQNKYVQLIRVGEGRYFALALGKDEITLIGEVASEDLKQMPADDQIPTIKGDFKELLDKLINKSSEEEVDRDE